MSSYMGLASCRRLSLTILGAKNLLNHIKGMTDKGEQQTGTAGASTNDIQRLVSKIVERGVIVPAALMIIRISIP